MRQRVILITLADSHVVLLPHGHLAVQLGMLVAELQSHHQCCSTDEMHIKDDSTFHLDNNLLRQNVNSMN